MNASIDIDCAAAREGLSAARDGEPGGASPAVLDAHLARCDACREHERALDALAPGWAALRDVAPPAELGRRLAERARPRPRALPRIALRIAAGLVGYAALDGSVRWLERGAAHSGRDLVERVAAGEPAAGALLAALPEVRLLRRLPVSTTEEPR